MTARSQTRTRSHSGTSASRRRRPTQSAQAQPLLIGSLALGVVVLVVIFAMGRDRDPAGTDKPADATQNVIQPKPRAGSISGGTARPGRTPGRAAPVIEAADLDAADALYRDAAKIWNQAQDARKVGETKLYQDKCLVAWEVLNKLMATISDYTAWFEEADLEDWAMPAEYDVLQQRLGKWDGLRIRVKKVKPAKRR